MLMAQPIFENMLKETGKEIFDDIGKIASTKYIRSGGGLPVEGKLTSQSGRLATALQGGAGSLREIFFTEDQAHFRMGLDAGLSHIYSIHEDGGMRNITPGMRKFFWAKYFQGDARKKMWKILALFKTTEIYPRRSFLQDAFRFELKEAGRKIKRKVGLALELELKRIINDNKKDT